MHIKIYPYNETESHTHSGSRVAEVPTEPAASGSLCNAGSTTAPPSKSMAHRLLICAALADGVSHISNTGSSDDVTATISCMRALGAGSAILDCRESGSTLRFLIPLCALSGNRMILTGSRRLMERPLSVYEELFRERGIILKKLTHPTEAELLSGEPASDEGEMPRGRSGSDEGEMPRGEPAFERAVTVQGRLRSGEFIMDGSVSSQFVSGMLFALPLLEGNSVIRLTPPVESRPYIDMTIKALEMFGVKAYWGSDETDASTGSGRSIDNIYNIDHIDNIDHIGHDEQITERESVIYIPGGQKYHPRDVIVEGDWSGAAYLLALGAEVKGLDAESLQGDRICIDYFKALEESCAELDITDCPDLGPVLMAYAALHHGCKLTGTRRLRIKESDRGLVMQEELAKFGIHVEVQENSITVSGSSESLPASPDETGNPTAAGCLKTPLVPLDGHNDHRIVMALAVLCTKTGGTIRGAEAVSKSFPEFFDRLNELGIKTEEI